MKRFSNKPFDGRKWQVVTTCSEIKHVISRVNVSPWFTNSCSCLTVLGSCESIADLNKLERKYLSHVHSSVCT